MDLKTKKIIVVLRKKVDIRKKFKSENMNYLLSKNTEKYIQRIEEKKENNNKIFYFLLFFSSVSIIIAFSFFSNALIFFPFLLLGLFGFGFSINHSIDFDSKIDYEKFNYFKNGLKQLLNNITDNKNFRNNQNYIINRNIIDRKLFFINYDIDEKEKMYTYKVLGKFIFSLLGFLLLGFFISIFKEKLFIIFLIFIYNIYLFFKRQFYFFPRRKRLYTILKYSPILDIEKIVRKL